MAMEITVVEKGGVFRVSALGLVRQSLTVYKECGGITLEVRDVQEVEEEMAVEFERVPVFAPGEEGVKGVEEGKEVEKVEEVRDAEEEAVSAFINMEARNNALFHKLADLRKELAAEANYPPYMIFHDKTLWGMVERMPQDLQSMGKISGVGKAKLQKYGALFLSIIKEVS